MKSSNVAGVKMSSQINHRSENLILFPLYWLNIFLICGIRCYVVCFLVPENAENEGDALLQFTAEFSSR